MTSRELRVRASTWGHEPGELRARVNEFEPRERLRRGLRAFLPYLGAGVALVLLPPHLIWLIGWTTVGVISGRRRWRQEREFVSLDGACPGCAADPRLALPDQLPMLQRCRACGAFLRLELAS